MADRTLRDALYAEYSDYPNWELKGSTYAGLRWWGDRPKPTEAELAAAMARVAAATDPLARPKSAAKVRIVEWGDNLSRPILSAYPEAERAGWLAKEAEALAFMAIDSRDRTAADAPLIEMVSQAQNGDETDPARLATITAKVERILQKATEWRALSANIEGFRSKYDVLIDAASSDAEIATIMAAAEAEITAVRIAFGL